MALLGSATKLRNPTRGQISHFASLLTSFCNFDFISVIIVQFFGYSELILNEMLFIGSLGSPTRLPNPMIIQISYIAPDWSIFLANGYHCR